MTQEDKDLLLKDLSSRLPYGLKVSIPNTFYDIPQVVEKIGKDCSIIVNGILHFDIFEYIPYLRPMSSMTEEEEREIMILWNEDFASKESLYHCYPKTIDYYNAHHFDYRNLIGMGLALEASKDMY